MDNLLRLSVATFLLGRSDSVGREVTAKQMLPQVEE